MFGGFRVKRIGSFLLALVMCLCLIPMNTNVYAARNYSAEENLAQVLKDLGLFQGVSDTEFDLERKPTRVEAIVMLIRLLGKENEAKNGKWSHPFSDVPEWANNYVGYAYTKGIANGISNKEFGTGNASSVMYLTFVLRSLGYTDGVGGDFVWDGPNDLAKKVGILNNSVDTNKFYRADVVQVSYLALSAKLKNEKRTLSDKLIEEGVYTKERYTAALNRTKNISCSVSGATLTGGMIQTAGTPNFSYVLYTPKNATDNMPLVVYLHETGITGLDVDNLVKKDSFVKLLQNGKLGSPNCYILMPLLEKNVRGWEGSATDTLELIEKVARNLNVDTSKISLTGYGMGGTGVWEVVTCNKTNMFYKMATVSGISGIESKYKSNLNSVLIQSYVGEDDTKYKPDSLQSLYSRDLKSTNASLTVVKDANYADMVNVYSDYGILEWLVS